MTETIEQLSKLLDPKVIITIITLAAVVFILLFISKKGTYTTKVLAYGALSIALGFILSFIKFSFPFGGSITLVSMLPIFIFAYIAGPRAGIAAGLAYGLLQLVQEPYILNFAQLVLEYPVAFALLGIAGFFKKNIFVGVIVGGLARYLCHFLAGFIFFAEYAPESQGPYLYSLAYNGSYMIPEIILCCAILLVPTVKKLVYRLKLK